MNERIRDLALLAHSDALESYRERMKTEFAGDVIFSDMYDQNFAKLIVRECYEYCKDELMDISLAEEAGFDYNDGVMDCAIGLLQHFGVEK